MNRTEELKPYLEMASELNIKDYFQKYEVEEEYQINVWDKKNPIMKKRNVMLFTKEVNEQILKENNKEYFLIINGCFIYKRDNNYGIDDNGHELISKYYKLTKSKKGGESLNSTNWTKYYKEILFKYLVNHRTDGINKLTKEDIEMLLTESDVYDRQCFLYNLDKYYNKMFKLL